MVKVKVGLLSAGVLSYSPTCGWRSSLVGSGHRIWLSGGTEIFGGYKYSDTHFFYKNSFYKNHEAQISQNLRIK